MSDSAREWFSFDDPGEEGTTWRVDVTFLLSHWHCIYGRGCQGILSEPNAVEGCCSYGAHYSDDDDRKRVTKAARRLKPEHWQLYDVGKRTGIGKTKTRKVGGRCIFLNRDDFSGGMGCALHIGALAAGESPIDWKPDVCWQLPLKLRDEGDGHYVIEEFGRSGFGPGGDEFYWWCTEAPEAFTAKRRVYQTLEDELRKLMGDPAYEVVAAYLDRRGNGKRRRRSIPVTVGHPAEAEARLGRG